MKTVWKWVLGIVIVLVVIGLVVVGVFAVQRRFAFAMRSAPFAYRQFQQTAPAAPSNPNSQNNQSKPASPTSPATPHTPNRPMMRRGFGGGYGYGPMMMGRGPMMLGGGFNRLGTSNRSGSFGTGFMFLALVGLIVLIAAVAAVAFVFYQLGKNAGIASALLAQQASHAMATTDTDSPARSNRGRR